MFLPDTVLFDFRPAPRLRLRLRCRDFWTLRVLRFLRRAFRLVPPMLKFGWAIFTRLDGESGSESMRSKSEPGGVLFLYGGVSDPDKESDPNVDADGDRNRACGAPLDGVETPLLIDEFGEDILVSEESAVLLPRGVCGGEFPIPENPVNMGAT